MRLVRVFFALLRRGDVQLAKLQVGFVNYVIMPFFEIVTHHIAEFKVASIQCRDNVLSWYAEKKRLSHEQPPAPPRGSWTHLASTSRSGGRALTHCL
jgi:hypothetical protein